MNLKFGYTPVQDNITLSLQPFEKYTEEICCDFENVYFKEYMGYHQQQYYYCDFPIDGIESFETELSQKQINEIKSFALKRFDYPIKGIWEFISHDGNKIRMTLEETDDIPFLKLERFSESIESPLVFISKFELKELKNIYLDEQLKHLTTGHLEGLSILSNYLNYEFEIFDLSLSDTFHYSYLNGKSFGQVILNKDHSTFQLYKWEQKNSISFNKYEIAFPIDFDEFASITKNYGWTSDYNIIMPFRNSIPIAVEISGPEEIEEINRLKLQSRYYWNRLKHLKKLQRALNCDYQSIEI